MTIAYARLRCAYCNDNSNFTESRNPYFWCQSLKSIPTSGGITQGNPEPRAAFSPAPERSLSATTKLPLLKNCDTYRRLESEKHTQISHRLRRSIKAAWTESA